MAFDKRTLFYSGFFLLVFGIGNIEAQSCGGFKNASYGVFMSPYYPNVYGTYLKCIYEISLPTNSSIALDFETFELDRSSGDYITINCSSNYSYSQQVYYWNNNIPPISIPWCSSGRVYFVSDSIRPFDARGFRVQYQVNTIGCGNTVFTASSGTISSPNYLQNYSNNENCTYSIWSSQLSSFTLSFQTFSLESDCQHDWVQIMCDNTNYILPKYCGSTIPKPAYIENCNKMLVWFHTDASVVSSGFRLQYSVTPNGCGKLTYAGLSGSITSPNYPQNYSGISCSYYIYPVSSVTLTFQAFDLEPFIDSSYGDYVQIDCLGNQIFDSHYYRGKSIPRPVSFTMCSQVLLYFYANNAISGAGFKVQYQVTPLVPHSDITIKSTNIAAYAGTRVQIDCTSSATGYLPSWTLKRDGTYENTIVIASFCLVNSEYTSQYTVLTEGQGICNLVIVNATLTQAGVYTCIDVSLASVSSTVSVVIATSTTSTKPDTTVIVLATFLAVCLIGYIVLVIFYFIRRFRETLDSSQNDNYHSTNNNVLSNPRPSSKGISTSDARPAGQTIPNQLVQSGSLDYEELDPETCYDNIIKPSA